MPVSQTGTLRPGRFWVPCLVCAVCLSRPQPRGCAVMRKWEQSFPSERAWPVPRLQSLNFPGCSTLPPGDGPGAGGASCFFRWAPGKGLCGHQAHTANLLKGRLGEELAGGRGCGWSHLGERVNTDLGRTGLPPSRAGAPPSCPLCTHPSLRLQPWDQVPSVASLEPTVPPPHLSSPVTKRSTLPRGGRGGEDG